MSASMMIPLLGQLRRSLWRVVSVVIVSPHFGCPSCEPVAVALALGTLPRSVFAKLAAAKRAAPPSTARTMIFRTSYFPFD